MYFKDNLADETSFSIRPLRPLASTVHACNAVFRFAEKYDGRFIKDPPVLTAMQNRATKPNGSSLEILTRLQYVLTYYANYVDKFKFD